MLHFLRVPRVAFQSKNFINRSFWWLTQQTTQSNLLENEEKLEFQKPGPKEQYLDLANRGLISHDDIQFEAVQIIDNINQSFRRIGTSTSPSSSSSTISMNAKGVYLYGGVGRGKTMIMDLFYTSLDIHDKSRVHFHSWMLEIHRRLHKSKGQGNPLVTVAADIAKKSRVLCLDELEITDVADAFVLRWLFEKLWTDHNVLTVFTSNAPPDRLYAGGINRSSFTPFIDQLCRQCTVVSLDVSSLPSLPSSSLSSHTSTISNPIPSSSIRRIPSGSSSEQTQTHMTSQQITSDTNNNNTRLHSDSISDKSDLNMDDDDMVVVDVKESRSEYVARVALDYRTLSSPSIDNHFSSKGDLESTCSGDVARFTFAQLCGSVSARGAVDYITIADRYSCVVVEGVPLLGGSRGDDEARRFITLVDVLYEQKSLLVIQADVMPHDLFRWDIDGEGEGEGDGYLDRGGDGMEYYDMDGEGEGEGMDGLELDRIEDRNEYDHTDTDTDTYTYTFDTTSNNSNNSYGDTDGYTGDMDDNVDVAVLAKGGSSGRNVTMIRTPPRRTGHQGSGVGVGDGYVEWSATGLPGASLATAHLHAQQQQGAAAGYADSFTRRASSRTVSRLLQMSGEAWLSAWKARTGRGGRDGGH
eukprot:gene7166-14586_t